jgi:hypothetical protein
MAIDEVIDQAQEAAEGARERLINVAAVMVAIIATFLALCGVKADNMDYGILQEKSDAVDQWNMYQAKSMKQYMYKLQRDSLQATLLTATGASPKAVAAVNRSVAQYTAEINRYEQEKEDVSAKAKEHEANAERMNRMANLLDLTDVFLSLSISLLAITILTKRWWMFFVALVPSLVGVVFGLAALLNSGWDVTLPSFLN